MLLKFIATIMITMSLFTSGTAEACVGRILQVGALDTPDGRVMGEALAVMITERTGTIVQTNYFESSAALYKAVAEGKIGILMENTTMAMQRMGKESPADIDEAYAEAKQLYRKELNLVWLAPFNFTNNVQDTKPSRTATLISLEVAQDFPGLPRLINKFAKRVTDKDYIALVETVKSGTPPRSTAMQFLNTKKLI